MNPECLSCKHIGNCATVTPEKIVARFVCTNYAEVAPEQLKARHDVVTKFGESGIKALLTDEEKEEE